MKDFNLTGGGFETAPIKLFAQQIRMMLGTRPRESYGNADAWPDLSAYVFSTTIDADALASEIARAISAHCPLAASFRHTAEVRFLAGSERDICFIDVNIYEYGSLSPLETIKAAIK